MTMLDGAQSTDVRNFSTGYLPALSDAEATQVIAEADAITRVSAHAAEFLITATLEKRRAITDSARDSAQVAAHETTTDLRMPLAAATLDSLFGPYGDQYITEDAGEGELALRFTSLGVAPEPRFKHTTPEEKVNAIKDSAIHALAKMPADLREDLLVNHYIPRVAGEDNELAARLKVEAGIQSDKIGNGGNYRVAREWLTNVHERAMDYRDSQPGKFQKLANRLLTAFNRAV